jgi:hypothetical protein
LTGVEWDVLLAALIETGITALHAEMPSGGLLRVGSFDDDGTTEDDGTDSTDIGVRVFALAVAHCSQHLSGLPGRQAGAAVSGLRPGQQWLFVALFRLLITVGLAVS